MTVREGVLTLNYFLNQVNYTNNSIMADYVFYKGMYRGHSVNDTIPSPVGKYLKRRQDTDTGIRYYSDGYAWINSANENFLISGLSTQTKPTMPQGYRFYETDTCDTFVSDGTYWWLNGLPSTLSKMKSGYMAIGTGSNVGTGVLSSMAFPSGAGGTGLPLTDITNGRYMRHTTGATAGNKCGQRLSIATFLRAWNFQIRVRFALESYAVSRLHIGVINSTTEPTGDNPLNIAHGFLWGMNTQSAVSNTNWLIQHNDGAGSTVVDNSGTAFDANVHTISIVARDGVPKIAWKLDNGEYNDITTELPGSQEPLVFYAELETAEAVGKVLRLYDGFVQSDR